MLADLSFTWTSKLYRSISHSASGQFPPVFSGFSTELLQANPRFGHGGRTHIKIYYTVVGKSVSGKYQK